MDILNQVYQKSLAENDRNLRFWEEYLQSLKTLDFSTFSEKLKVPALVPIGSRILFRGELKHTNEVTVALGADYFVKCSIKQAEVIRQHRIKVAQARLDEYLKEKEYLENQMFFTKKTYSEPEGQEIIEYHSQEEDKAWRVRHKENMRLFKQKGGDKEPIKDEITDDELWNRLEELELQEELENEMAEMNENQILKTKSKESFVVEKDNDIKIKEPELEKKAANITEKKDIEPQKVSFKEEQQHTSNSKYEMLQQVIERQNELEEKLQEMKNKERVQSKNEQELISRLDELEQLDELEDEMDRLDDIIEDEDTDDEIIDVEPKLDKVKASSLKQRVSFIDEDDSVTLEVNFKHSPLEPDQEPYNADKGILKPSDIYEAYSKNFNNGTTSILKKSKYGPPDYMPEVVNEAYRKMMAEDKHRKSQNNEIIKNIGQLTEHKEESIEHQTIVVKDVVETVEAVQSNNKPEFGARPTSLFKKKRMQNKS